MKNITEYINNQMISESYHGDIYGGAEDLLKSGYDYSKLQSIINDLTKDTRKLPSTDEFEKACEDVVKLHSKPAIATFIEAFKDYLNAGGKYLVRDNTTLDKVFVLKGIQDHIKTLQDYEVKQKMYNSVFSEFFKYWGTDWDSMPDYQKGLQILSKEFNK